MKFFSQKEGQLSSPILYGDNSEKGKYIKSTDAKIYYEVYGSGKPLVALHGGITGCPYEMGRILDQLQKQFQVIVISSRGHGHSEIGQIFPSLEQKAKDVYTIIKEITKEKVILLGFDDGAYTSYYVARLFPEKIEKVIAIGAGTLKKDSFPKLHLDYIEKNDKDFYEQQKKLMPEPNRWEEFTKDYMNYYNELNFGEEILGRIQCQVLVMSGDNDEKMPLDSIISAYKNLPNKKLSIIPNAGHCCFNDNYDVTMSTIKDFLKEPVKELQCEVLLKTSKSWDGVDLPNYLVGKPEIQMCRYIIPPKTRMQDHFHLHMSFGKVVKGQLTIVKKDGGEKTFYEGDTFAETVNTIHYGVNKGDEPIELFVANAMQEGMPLSTKV